MTSKISTAAMMVSAGLVLASCGHGSKRSDSGASGSPQGVGLSDADQAAEKKMQPVVECWNEPVQGLVEDAEQYRRQIRPLMASSRPPSDPMQTFDAPTLFQGTTTSANSNGEMSRACADKLEAAARSGPAIAGVDEAAPKLAAALRQLIGPAKALDDYFEQKVYLDDHWAKGRTIDAQLAPVLVELTTAGERTYSGMQAEKAVLDQHRLDAIEKRDGRSLDWHAERTRIAAHTMVEQAEAMQKAGKLDAVAMEKLTSALQSDYDAAQAYAAAHPEATKDRRAKSPLWPDLAPAISHELSNARDLHRTLATPESDRASHADSVRRDVEDLESSYNSVVFTYNQHQR